MYEAKQKKKKVSRTFPILKKNTSVSMNILQMNPIYLSKKEAENYVRKVMDEKGITFDWNIVNKYSYINKIMWDDKEKQIRAGWNAPISIEYYLHELIKKENQQEFEYNEIKGDYGSIPSNIVKVLVEDYGANIETLQKAVDTITSKNGNWNVVRIINKYKSELKLTVLQGNDLRVFAGEDRVFRDIKKALHKG